MTDRFKVVEQPGTQTHPDHESNACSDLWRSVICQAVRDLARGQTAEKLEVAQWVGTEDFEEVCDLAGIDFGWLEKDILSCCAHPDPYRGFYLMKLLKRIGGGTFPELEQEAEPEDPTPSADQVS